MVTRPNEEYVSRTQGYARAQAAEIDAGLRAHMQKVYAYMSGGLALTGAVSYVVGNNDTLLALFFNSPLVWVVMFAPLVFVMFFSARIHAMSASAAQASFWVYAALVGLSLGYIFAEFTPASIFKTFFITAGTFLGMSLWGYTTKKDLSGMGNFLIMGVWGVLLAMIVNIFLKSSALEFGISVIGVVAFLLFLAQVVQAQAPRPSREAPALPAGQ